MEKLKIVLVDDKPVYRNAMRTLLQKIAEVDIIAEASDGFEFLEILLEKKPDLVFMDIEMPVMNGIEATKKALKKYPDLIIIGLSMYDNEKYIDDLISAGAKGYLLKLSDNAKIFKQILENPRAEVFFSKEIAPAQTETLTKKQTILIVDDFENTRFVIEFTLKQAGYEVYKAASGNEALRYCDGRKIDLVITDYNMPGMDGVELVENIRKIGEYHDIPILLLTTETNQAKKDRAKAVGVTGWIQKPFVVDKFLAFVKKALK